jgi:divalent metal cation (Fe/Co/Zn/Cd) transporter
MRSGAPDSLRTVVVALVTNLATALAKLVAALFSGSSAMWAAAFHAFADTGNEVLLLIAERRSGRPADEQHPLGHGRAAYFWALIASMAVFALGALLSVQLLTLTSQQAQQEEARRDEDDHGSRRPVQDER